MNTNTKQKIARLKERVRELKGENEELQQITQHQAEMIVLLEYDRRKASMNVQFSRN